MPGVDVLAVIVTFNTRSLVEKCLLSLGSASGSVSVRPVVVDNGSSDGTAAYLRSRFPDLDLVALPENVGFGAAVNQGVAGRAARFVLVTNSDIEFTLHSIDGLVARAKDLPHCGIIGPQLRDPDGHLQLSCGLFMRPFTPWREIGGAGRPTERAMIQHYALRTSAVEYVAGAAMLMRYDVFVHLNGFDERFFFYSEDMDFCLKAFKQGWLTYLAPEISVIHVRGASSTRVDHLKFDLQHARAQIQYAEKHFSSLGRRFWLLGVRTLIRLRIARCLLRRLAVLLGDRFGSKQETQAKLTTLRALSMVYANSRPFNGLRTGGKGCTWSAWRSGG